MKHVFSVLSIACVAFFTILLSTTNSGCKKGDDGAKGDTGTANVMYSPWLDVKFTPQLDTNGDTAIWTATIPATKITRQIIDSGVVKVFWNANTTTNPAVFALPITDVYGLGGVINLNVYFTVGNINLYATDDPSTITLSSGKYNQFRYVIIPGGVPTGRSAVNLNDYKTVKQLYGLTD